MDQGKLFGRGISFPPRLGPDGRMAFSEGSENVRESIRVILLTESQERLLLPEFGGGLGRFLFEPNAVPTHRLIEERITQSLGRWEPRIKVQSVSVRPDAEDPEAAVATVEYKLVATGAREQTSLTVQLAAGQ